jgi:uncharacterized SAM-binding protein YcdF (DUF218 family)
MTRTRIKTSIHPKNRPDAQTRSTRRTRSSGRTRLRTLIGVLIIWFLLHGIYVLIDGLNTWKGHADIAVVLGNRVDKDSSLSPVLQGRVDRAIRLYREGQVQKIMVSGGVGKDPDDVPEGMAMKRYLVQKGIPAGNIIEDNGGADTWLTAKNFIKMADSLHLSSAIVVTSFYHVTRSKYIIRKLGFGNVHSASSEAYFWNDLIGLPRDIVAFYKYWLVY